MRVAAVVATVLALAPSWLGGALGPRYGGRLSLSVDALPATLLPSRAAAGGERAAAALIHETLVRYDPERGVLPGVAAQWRATSGGREWELRLSPWARFHDGQPVSADDAVRSLRRFLRSRSPAAALLAQRLAGGTAFRAAETEELAGVSALSPDRLALRLLAPAPEPLAPLAALAAAVTSASQAGCGPFAPASFEPQRRLTAVAAAAHPRGRPFLDRVEILAREEGGTGLREGPGRVSRLSSVLLLQLDAATPPFDRPDARRAVAASIDRALLASRFLPSGRPSGSLLPVTLAPTLPGPPPARHRLSGDVVLAVARDVPPSASQRIVAHLGALGLTLRVRVIAPGDPAPETARLRVWTPEVAERGLALRELSSLEPAPPGADRALRRAEAELDAALRDEALADTERALRAEAALIPLALVPAAFEAGPGVHGARVDAAGRLRLEDAWVEP